MNDAKIQGTNFSDKEMLSFYRQMLLIRQIEQQLSKDSKAGNLPGPVHV